MKSRSIHEPDEGASQGSRGEKSLKDNAAPAVAKSPFAMRRILVPIDFSDCSRKALRYAIPLAKAHGAALTLLYVVPPALGVGEFGATEYAQWEASMREAGEQQLAELRSEEVHEEIVADSLVRAGSPAREIIETARALPVDLIVISTHGRTGLSHVFLGSVTEHVVQRAPCPVFVVREREVEILAS